MLVRFLLRRDVAADWTSINPVLQLGEPGLETDTRKVKYGDGVTAWASLPYSAADLDQQLIDIAGLVYAGNSLKVVRVNAAETAFELAIVSGGAGLADGDYGDITVGGVGTTMTIDAGVVTLAKQADMATASVVYRKTAGAGPPEVQTLATLKIDLGLSGSNSGDQDLSGYAPLVSPTFTGTPAAPTAAAPTNTTQIATTAFVATAIANLINSAPGALDTLDELAAAFGDDPNFAATMTTALAGKQPLDADLNAIAILITTGFGRSFLELADAPAGRTLLALGALAIANTINNADWLGADLAIANGGTGASTAATARSALGLEIGVNVQAYDAQLADIAGLTYAGNAGKVVKVNAGATALELLPDDLGGAVGALALNQHVLAANFTVTAGYACYIPRYIEVGAGITLEVGAGGTMEIG